LPRKRKKKHRWLNKWLMTCTGKLVRLTAGPSLLQQHRLHRRKNRRILPAVAMVVVVAMVMPVHLTGGKVQPYLR